MSDFLGIDLIAGLDEEQSKEQIDRNIKTLSGNLDQLKIKIDIDEKALDTIKTFNEEIKKVSKVTEDTGHKMDNAFKSNSENQRTEKIKELNRETQKLGDEAERQSRRTQANNKAELKTLSELEAGYKRIKTAKTYNEKGEVTGYKYDLADQNGDFSRVVNTNLNNEVTSYRDVDAIEKQNQRLKQLADEREKILQKIADTQQKHGDYVDTSKITQFNEKANTGNIESLKKLSSEVDNYGQELTKVQNLDIFKTDMAQKIKALDFKVVGKIDPELNKQLNDILNNVSALTPETEGLPIKMKQLSQSFKGVSQDVLHTNQAMARFGAQLASAVIRVPIYAVTMKALSAPVNMFNDALSQILEIDAQVTEIKRVTNGAEDLNLVLEDSVDIAGRLGNTIKQVNDGLIDFARQGFRGDDLTAMTEVATVMSNVSDLSVESSASSLTAAIKGFNIEAQDSIRIVDALNEVNVSASCYSNVA